MATELPMNYERRFSTLEEVTALLTAAKGRTFRDLDETGRSATAKNKGVLGQIVEESVLHYPLNSDKQADIQVGNDRYEIKVTPLKHIGKASRRRTVAKERLVLDIINYMELPREMFYTSTFWLKSHHMIIIYYYDDRTDKDTQNIADCTFLDSFVFNYTEDDLATIREDWEMIKSKVAAGYADRLSESDTNYLAACTKGANSQTKRNAPAPLDFSQATIQAKQRAFSFKNSYMTAIAGRVLGEKNYALPLGPDQGLMSYVRAKMDGFVGMEASRIASELGIPFTEAKQTKQILALGMLGAGPTHSVKSIDQFRKANVTGVKTTVLYPDVSHTKGMPKESMAFRAISQEEWKSLADPKAQWEDSFLYSFFEENRFLFVCFKSQVAYSKHNAADDVLVGGFLWNMPEEDIQRYVKPVWMYLHQLMLSGKSIQYERGLNQLPGTSFNGVFHLRPKALNADDTVLLPNGEQITKQCFWLDRRYIAKIVANQIGV